jgi:arsenate reductase (glutaredoxin)
VSVAAELGVDADVVQYLKQKPDRAALERLVSILQDPVTDLVRRDATFTKMGLTDADVSTADQVVEVLLATPKLLQRPVIVKGDRAIIGRPKDKVRSFLS